MNYKEPDFETRALQHSKVKLTWEDEEPERKKVLRRKFNPDQVLSLHLPYVFVSVGFIFASLSFCQLGKLREVQCSFPFVIYLVCYFLWLYYFIN
jgi:hypothetical protein